MAKEIFSITQKPDHYGNVATFTDAREVKKREIWNYLIEFKGLLKPGKTYKITVEEV